MVNPNPEQALSPEPYLVVNGRPHAWEAGMTVADLLERTQAGPSGVAVERNGEVVRKRDHASVRLEPGDCIEIVRLVGGG